MCSSLANAAENSSISYTTQLAPRAGWSESGLLIGCYLTGYGEPCILAVLIIDVFFNF